jgi:hypothetical protein
LGAFLLSLGKIGFLLGFWILGTIYGDGVWNFRAEKLGETGDMQYKSPSINQYQKKARYRKSSPLTIYHNPP